MAVEVNPADRLAVLAEQLADVAGELSNSAIRVRALLDRDTDPHVGDKEAPGA